MIVRVLDAAGLVVYRYQGSSKKPNLTTPQVVLYAVFVLSNVEVIGRTPQTSVALANLRPQVAPYAVIPLKACETHTETN